MDTGSTMTKTNKRHNAAYSRMEALNEERVAMVMRREKPVLIHAISAAYLKAYEEVYGEDQTRPGRDCADPRP